MKCSQHIERDAVSQCTDCGRALCPECTAKWSFPICDVCNYNRAENDKKLVIKNMLITIPLFVLGFWYAPDQAPFTMKLMFGYMLAGLPWGWSVLSRITSNIFLFLPIFGWFLYFIVKLSISLFIGEFVLPYKLFLFFKSYKNAQQVQTSINNNY